MRLLGVLRRLRDQPDLAGSSPDMLAATLTPVERAIVERCRPHTLTSVERMLAVIDAVRYCQARGVEGAFVECGVWRGGSVLAMLLTLLEDGSQDRDVFLFDTFEGMTEPGDVDTSPFEASAAETFADAERTGTKPFAEYFDPQTFTEAHVVELLAGTGYPAGRLHFVRGAVEDTLPDQAPERIALLRLDTDWYESTRHELEHLYDRLQPGGVLIVDDYGHWDGARRAVDEFFADRPALLLHRTDYTGRVAVKA